MERQRERACKLTEPAGGAQGALVARAWLHGPRHGGKVHLPLVTHLNGALFGRPKGCDQPYSVGDD